MTIWKYELQLTSEPQTVQMPHIGEVISVQNQNNQICFWALVDSERKLVPRRFLVVGTGQEFDEGYTKFISTVQIGPFVWHVFAMDQVN